MYVCPSCGGHLKYDIDLKKLLCKSCDNNEGASFCMYCGASNVLEGRLSYEKRPEEIIPFSVNKDKCKKICKDLHKRRIFAPSNLSREGIVDGFRGIYMPFYVYNNGI